MQQGKKEPARILQIVTSMDRGGLETMIMNYYRNIDRTKIQFDFLTHTDQHQDYEEEILSMGGKIYYLPRLNPFSITYRRKLNRFFEEHPEYRVVHCHRDCMSGIPLKAAKRAGVPVRIAHSHNTYQTKDLKLPLKLWYMRCIPQFATELFACSKPAGDWMFKGHPYVILRNAIDAGLFRYDSIKADEMKKSLGVERHFVVGHVGQFRVQKNHLFLIDVFAKVMEKCPESILLLVGDGARLNQTRAKAQEYGIENNVKFLGSRSDISEIMQAMDVFVLPSFHEGLPVTMIEAQTAGLPCIISDGVPIECKITDHVEQVKLSDGSAVWAERILNFKNVARKNNCEAVAAAGFDIKSNVQWLEEFYCDAVERN